MTEAITDLETLDQMIEWYVKSAEENKGQYLELIFSKTAETLKLLRTMIEMDTKGTEFGVSVLQTSHALDKCEGEKDRLLLAIQSIQEHIQRTGGKDFAKKSAVYKMCEVALKKYGN